MPATETNHLSGYITFGEVVPDSCRQANEPKF